MRSFEVTFCPGSWVPCCIGKTNTSTSPKITFVYAKKTAHENRRKGGRGESKTERQRKAAKLRIGSVIFMWFHLQGHSSLCANTRCSKILCLLPKCNRLAGCIVQPFPAAQSYSPHKGVVISLLFGSESLLLCFFCMEDLSHPGAFQILVDGRESFLTRG